MTILIVGGSGGIGFSIVKCFLHYYPGAKVIATYNSNQLDFEHPNLQWYKLDITSEKEIENLSNKIGFIDILVNSAGILHSSTQMPEKTIKNFDLEFFYKNISANTLPGVLLAKHFMTSMNKQNNTFFIVISAKIGSISDNKTGGWLSYRASKSALNMAIKTISMEWKIKVPNCCVLLFHPGTTDTDLSKPFQKNLPEGQLHSPEVTAKSLFDLIEKSNPNDSGKFISFDGSEITW